MSKATYHDISTGLRLFTANDLVEGGSVAGTPAQAHYLGSVMRRAVGDTVRLFNGRDGEHAASIATLRKDRLNFSTGPRLRPLLAEPDVWLVFALLKRDATDLVVQKATELGVSAILPVFCARTNAARVNVERLCAIAMEAAEQSERLTVPLVHEPVDLFDLLGDWPAQRRLAAAIERSTAPGLAPGPGALLVGPEGGFTPRELDLLGSAPFIEPVSLGGRVLRAETAAIAGLALMLARP